jgi:hypothetical protein
VLEAPLYSVLWPRCRVESALLRLAGGRRGRTDLECIEVIEIHENEQDLSIAGAEEQQDPG